MRYSLALLALLLVPTVAHAKLPDDPQVRQWGYKQTQVYEAWDISTGSDDVIVAIIDNGFDHLHPDLKDNTWTNTDEIPDNNIDDDNNGYIDDIHGWSFVAKDRNRDGRIDANERKGWHDPRPDVTSAPENIVKGNAIHHASVVAGIIGAVGNNNRDGSGINWKVKMMNIQLLDSTGIGTIEHIADAIYYAVDNGADVINISIVSTDSTDEFGAAIDYAYEHGVVVVAAAGNNTLSLEDYPRYPICSDAGESVQKVLGVSAIGIGKTSASFSNYGASCVDITAPGVDIEGTLRYAPSAGLTESYSDGWNGTSFAAPFVSGAAALIKSVQPTWGAKEIYKALLSTVHKTPTQDEATYAALFGKGLLQIENTVKYAQDALPKTPVEVPVTSPPVSLAPLVFTHLVAANTQNGVLSKFTLATKSQKKTVLSSVNGAMAIAVTKIGDDIYWATASKISEDTVQIIIFDARMRVVDFWDQPYTGDIDIAIGNFDPNTTAPEIAISPRTASKTVVQIKDTQGNVLSEYVLPYEHTGARVKVVEGTSQLAIAYALEGAPGMHIERLRGDLTPIDTLLIISQDAKDVAVADLDGSEHVSYIVSTVFGGHAAVQIFDNNGKLQQLLRFDEADVEVLAADADLNGKAEVYIYAPETNHLYIYEAPLESEQASVYTLEGDTLLPFFAS